MEEIFDSAEPPGIAADALDEAGRICVNSPFAIGVPAGLIQQPGRDRLVGRRVGSLEGDAVSCIRSPGAVRIWDHDGSDLDCVICGLTPVHVGEAQ
jgi:hypothetical protein